MASYGRPLDSFPLEDAIFLVVGQCHIDDLLWIFVKKNTLCLKVNYNFKLYKYFLQEFLVQEKSRHEKYCAICDGTR